MILDNNGEFTDALKDMGYDGTIQSEYGDEAVAFYPNQIKSADPVTYDDEGNVIPLSQRFNEENEDIRYSKKNLDTANKKAYNKRKKLYTDEFATNAMIWCDNGWRTKYFLSQW